MLADAYVASCASFLTVMSKDSDVDDTSSRYLMFDDTILSKTGKRMEKIGKVWDHVTNSYMLEFKLLVMMYRDGKSSISHDHGTMLFGDQRRMRMKMRNCKI